MQKIAFIPVYYKNFRGYGGVHIMNIVLTSGALSALAGIISVSSGIACRDSDV